MLMKTRIHELSKYVHCTYIAWYLTLTNHSASYVYELLCRMNKWRFGGAFSIKTILNLHFRCTNNGVRKYLTYVVYLVYWF